MKNERRRHLPVFETGKRLVSILRERVMHCKMNCLTFGRYEYNNDFADDKLTAEDVQPVQRHDEQQSNMLTESRHDQLLRCNF